MFGFANVRKIFLPLDAPSSDPAGLLRSVELTQVTRFTRDTRPSVLYSASCWRL